MRFAVFAVLIACAPEAAPTNAPLDAAYSETDSVVDVGCENGASSCTPRTCSCGLSYTLCTTCRDGRWEEVIDDTCFFGCGDAIFPDGPTAVPLFSRPPGTYASGTTITIASETAGAVIYYTTDGTTPNTSSAKYAAPIVLNTRLTLKAMALAPARLQSETSTARYALTTAPDLEPVTFTPPAGTYTTAQAVELTTTSSGATLQFTTDMSAPSCSSGVTYAKAITVTSSQTIRAIACRGDAAPSVVADAAYVIVP